MSTYQTRGPILLGSTAYVARQFEQDVVNAVHTDRWVLLLGPRQHGKTTGLIRIGRQLSEAGYLCARLDLQSAPYPITYEQLLEWLASELAESFKIESFARPVGIYERDVKAWLQAIIPPGEGKVVIIIDEAAAIEDRGILERFYGQLRAFHNKKADSAPGRLERRLIFVFAGTFLPEKLIDNTDNSPFNVCEIIDTEDLCLSQVEDLQSKVEGVVLHAECKEIFEIVGGQPYLVQKWLETYRKCRDLGRSDGAAMARDEVYAGMDGHFQSLLRGVSDNRRLMDIVRRMVDQNAVAMQPTSTDHRYLAICGLATIKDGNLVFRSTIYAEMAKHVCGETQIRV